MNRKYLSPTCNVINLWLGQTITIVSDVDSNSEDVEFLYDDGSDI